MEVGGFIPLVFIHCLGMLSSLSEASSMLADPLQLV